MLQACHGEVFVREAVVAISASRIARSGKAGMWSRGLSPIVAGIGRLRLCIMGRLFGV